MNIPVICLLALFVCPGLAVGQLLTKDINPNEENATANRFRTGYRVSGESVYYFIANDGATGDELWRSDGTADGTRLVKDINPGPSGSGLHDLVVLNETLYFVASNSTAGDELWRSDGTADGTRLVKDINPGPSGSFPHDLLGLNGQLFFTVNDGATGDELWRSDGTADGTRLVKDINPGSSGSFPHNLLGLNGQLFFTANDGATGDELWRSDGTADGTRLVKDINPGSSGSFPHNLLGLNGQLFFTANDGATGDELWRSNGTADGTRLVKDINPGSNSCLPRNYTSLGNLLYFVVYDGVSSDELWRSDGTAEGTVRIKSINPDTNGAYDHRLTVVDNTVYFITNDGVVGDELWRSDGTADGTRLVKDINPGPSGSFPHDLLELNGQLFFTANDGVVGDELCRSDGTADGTRLVKDINPGSNGSYPFDLIHVGTHLFFTANDGAHGQELWLLDAPASADLSIALVVSSRVPRVGEAVTYTLSLTNQSTSTRLPAATWINRLPTNLEFIDGQNVTYQNGVVTGQVTDLSAMTETQFTYRVKPTAPGLYWNAAQITSSALTDPDSQPDSGTGDGEDDSAIADMRTAEPGTSVFSSPNPNQRVLPTVASSQPAPDPNKADLSLAMVFSRVSAQRDDVVSVTLVVTNTGGQSATGVRIANQLPEGLQFMSGTGWTEMGKLLTNSIEQITGGDSVILSFQARVTGTGQQLNQAQITASNVADPDSSPGNGFSTGEDDSAIVTIRLY